MDELVDALIKDPSRVKPEFIQNPNMDKIISVLMRLAMENSVLRDRIDRQEKLLIARGLLSEVEFEEYAPSKETAVLSQAESFKLISAIINDLK